MAEPLEVVGPRAGSAPLTYELNELGVVELQAVFAHFDGTVASGSWRPTVTIRSQNGTILSRTFPSASLAVGDTADVTYAPFLGDGDSAFSLNALTGAVTLAGTSPITVAVAGQTITIAAPTLAPGWDATVTKAVDESVTSSIVLQNDDELFFTAVAGAVYEVSADLIYASPLGGTTPGLRIAWGEDIQPRGAMYDQILTITPAASVVNNMTDQGSTAPEPSKAQTATGGAKRAVLSRGWHAGNGGTFRFLWAQLISDPSATVIYAGSTLSYRRIF